MRSGTGRAIIPEPSGAPAESVAIATVAPVRKAGYGRSMSSFLATAVNTHNRSNLRANNRARPMRDCDQG